MPAHPAAFEDTPRALGLLSSPWQVPLANRLLPGDLEPDDVRVMHPIADLVRPVLGHPSWLVQRGHGSFVTMESGALEVGVREPGRREIETEPGSADSSSAEGRPGTADTTGNDHHE